MLARQRVDSLDPQGAKYALLLLAVAVGVGQPLLEGTAGLTIQLAPSDQTGGELHLAFVAAAGFGATLGARHVRYILPWNSAELGAPPVYAYGSKALTTSPSVFVRIPGIRSRRLRPRFFAHAW